MPQLPGFSDNPFQSRDDVLRASGALLKGLVPYKSACGARIKLSTATGTGFDETAAQLEGFARPLWVVADLLKYPKDCPLIDNLHLSSWVRGLMAGTDPNSQSYWGDVGDHDQRMVEMEPIAYALLSAPVSFLSPPRSSKFSDLVENDRAKYMLKKWLRSINEKVVPPSNWRWFRILVNLALVKSLEIPYRAVKKIMDADFEVLDSFYIADGWSSDGLWADDKKQADYYSGSFAIQYSQLLYMRFARDIDPERTKRYGMEAAKFAATFWRYFDVNGAAIPFGRSLTYRFAMAAFWSAVVVSGISLPSPLDQLGVVKGIILRHLRWWSKQDGIFNTDGTLNIGYTYPNMFMSEDYNSPQSVYWCLKTFSILGLAPDHPFWTCEELPHPLLTRSRQNSDSGCITLIPSRYNDVSVVKPPLQIVCSSSEHHFLLSAGQSTQKTHRAREAKYSKFAYSSAFGFSVPVGNSLAQMAPDSTICVSDDDGESWKVRWEPLYARIEQVIAPTSRKDLDTNDELNSPTVPVLVSGWKPWRNCNFQIDTILISPLDEYPGWHTRMHRISWQGTHSPSSFQVVDAGFAISSQSTSGGVLPQLNNLLKSQNSACEEFLYESDISCLVMSQAGASGVCSFPVINLINMVKHVSHASILKPDANTNLIARRTFIPNMCHTWELKGAGEWYFATGVFAVASSANLTFDEMERIWKYRPNLSLDKYKDLLGGGSSQYNQED